jgi:lipoprotein-anchoring transpeptidase ErfK/SrfK
MKIRFATVAAAVAFIGATCVATSVSANPLNLLSFSFEPPAPARTYDAPPPRYTAPAPTSRYNAPVTMRSDDSATTAMAYASPSQDGSAQSDSRLQRQVVNFPTHEALGTIIIDTPNTFLYLVMGNGKALRYGIGIGREGFTWSGTQTITNKKEWPDWTPPDEMIQRQPYLPRFMAGGPGNPLGARAMYLGGTVYRIHGTNDPTTIGKRVSSGCIRLTNEDVSDLFSRVNIGTKVVVLPMARTAAGARGVY